MSSSLRQVVLAARDLAAAVADLRAHLPLAEPFADPAVAEFGLQNAVMALGDTFLEVVSPVREGTAAGRFLERRGDGAYMLLFQVDDLAAARARARALGLRVVWERELPDIAAVHLHPGDVGAAIVSLDQPRPAESWRWAGPDWTGGAPSHPGGGVTGVTLRSPDPGALAERWRRLLEGAPGVDFELGEPEGIDRFTLAVPGRRSEDLTVAGARFLIRSA